MTERVRLTLKAQTTEGEAASRVEERDSSYVRRQVASALTAPNGPKRGWGSPLNTGLNEKRRQKQTTKVKENLLANTAEDLCRYKIWHSKFSRSLIWMIYVILDCFRKIIFPCQCKILNINIFFMYSRSTKWKHCFRTTVFQIFLHSCYILFLYTRFLQHLAVFERVKIYHVHII